ncbi:hypothetical protein [Bacillus sp. AFS075034]|uniref:hypothetical protein n=1 Tax=Bacillus sp. AFS075034 TaxID=2034281 RepID=UPI000BF6785D|nr:hypothetical protein [Bacillus sp. AFS075034]PFW61560.1 hypothetical protein COL20_17105 [Bacillus sp. AFS075034]
MKFYKVINFLKENGEADYKGLDTSQFKFEGQFYDFENKVCVIATKQLNFAGHKEVTELTQTEYKEIADIITQKNNTPNTPEEPNADGDRIEQLEAALVETTALLATQQQINIKNEQAIMELTQMIGGMTNV